MKRLAISILATVLLAATSGLSVAQTTPVKTEGEIQARKENQQKRIGNGLENGSLTPKEAAHLENKQVKLNKEIHHDRKVNGGNLTNKEKKQINRQQNRASEGIYDQKHNSTVQK